MDTASLSGAMYNIIAFIYFFFFHINEDLIFHLNCPALFFCEKYSFLVIKFSKLKVRFKISANGIYLWHVIDVCIHVNMLMRLTDKIMYIKI